MALQKCIFNYNAMELRVVVYLFLFLLRKIHSYITNIVDFRN
jgi:hypothetical protein